MKRFIPVAVLILLVSLGSVAQATNGDNLMGIGPVSRAMGGVGIAAPLDPITAVFTNPAAMCFGPYCPGSEFDFAGTVFSPTTTAKIQVPAAGINAGEKSQSSPFIIPAIGLSTPISSDWRFGLSAYGVSGMGVDYRNEFTVLGPGAGLFTQFSVMRFAPNVSYKVNDNFSLGANVQVAYGALDLGSGTSTDYGLGGQIGAIYRIGPVSLGLSYVYSSPMNYKRVSDFNGDGVKDDLELGSPQTLGFGIAVEPIKKLLVEADVKWINWAGAKGYRDFDWQDQYVFGLGAQYNPIPKLFVRAGVNYGRNPVKTHDGFNSISTTNVQGKSVPTFNYEFLRIVGFPAIVETHGTIGVGYMFTEGFMANVGYTKGFKNSISETGSNFGGPGGPTVTISSELEEDTFEFGLTWRF